MPGNCFNLNQPAVARQPRNWIWPRHRAAIRPCIAIASLTARVRSPAQLNSAVPGPAARRQLDAVAVVLHPAFGIGEPVRLLPQIDESRE